MITPLDENAHASNVFTEYVIKVKDEQSSLTEKYHTYDPLLLSIENKDLSSKVQDVYMKFSNKGTEGQEAPRIEVRAKMIWQA